MFEEGGCHANLLKLRKFLDATIGSGFVARTSRIEPPQPLRLQAMQ